MRGGGGMNILDSKHHPVKLGNRPNIMLKAKKFPALQLLLMLAVLTGERQISAREGGEVLTNAADVISLPAERASLQLKVRVRGIVTAADPSLKGRFFVQDSTGGVFVNNDNAPRPEPGDLVEVSGLSMVGAYAPIIMAPTLRKLGTAALPSARPVSIEKLMSGSEDSQRIEVSGLVRAMRVDGARLVGDLISGGYRFRIYMPIPPQTDPQTLVGAQVRVRGTAAEAHNGSLRQMISAEVYVPILADFIVEQAESASPFAQPVIALSSLAQYHRDNSFNERVHVRGIVTFQRPGENLFLQDGTGGLQVQSRQPGLFKPGEIIEAVGFPNIENFLPVLQDAVFHSTGEAPVTLTPKAASLEDVQNGLHHADYVSFKAKLIDRAVKQIRRHAAGPGGTRTTLVLENTNVIFTAEGDEPFEMAELALIPLGSVLEVSGICLTEIDRGGKVNLFRVLIRTPKDVRIIARPSWFTPQRLLIGLAAVCVILIVIVSWTVMVSKKNLVLNYLIREREKAQLALQRAHDQLEQRVKERTAELKFQVTARKVSEVQSKAVLAERTRLAQELHDTLEQTLTGIALQLDTAAKLFQRNPDGASRHLELSRNMMRQSQVELRRSVWDLRSRALEQFDLPGALLRSGTQITHGTAIQIEVETKGIVRPLPEVVEENLLRIGQEALTNILKHSRATLARIKLEFGQTDIVLEVWDNGSGFTPNNCAGANEGHFGLLGMSERAKRLNGQVLISSSPETGTRVHVEIPLGPVHELRTPELEEAQLQS